MDEAYLVHEECPNAQPVCGALLCIVNDEDGSNCIKEWHTKVNLRQVAQPARAGEEEKLNW